MGFYIRKSIKAGPFRFNLSNSGVGMSVGVRGLRVGTGPRGHYIRAGLGGVYYQQSITPAGAPQKVRAVRGRRPHPAQISSRSSIVMREVESADALDMRDGGFSEMLDELNRKQRQVRMSIIFPLGTALLGGTCWLALGNDPSEPDMSNMIFGLTLLTIAISWLTGRWLDSYRRVAVLAYDLDERVTRAYEGVAAAFLTLASSGKKFRVDAGGKVNDLTTWKRNAGASHLLKTQPITLDHQLPRVIRSNVMPPALRTGGRTFYFLPDVVLVSDRGGFGAVGYADLQIDAQPTRWIENGTAARDSQVVGHTWQHPNKSGGPDRRFKQNRQLAICLFDVMHMASTSGMNELMQFSRPGSVQPFKAALDRLPQQAVAASPRNV